MWGGLGDPRCILSQWKLSSLFLPCSQSWISYLLLRFLFDTDGGYRYEPWPNIDASPPAVTKLSQCSEDSNRYCSYSYIRNTCFFLAQEPTEEWGVGRRWERRGKMPLLIRTIFNSLRKKKEKENKIKEKGDFWNGNAKGLRVYLYYHDEQQCPLWYCSLSTYSAPGMCKALHIYGFQVKFIMGCDRWQAIVSLLFFRWWNGEKESLNNVPSSELVSDGIKTPSRCVLQEDKLSLRHSDILTLSIIRPVKYGSQRGKIMQNMTPKGTLWKEQEAALPLIVPSHTWVPKSTCGESLWDTKKFPQIFSPLYNFKEIESFLETLIFKCFGFLNFLYVLCFIFPTGQDCKYIGHFQSQHKIFIKWWTVRIYFVSLEKDTWHQEGT